MQVFRLCKARWAATAFSGEGGLRHAGRWHEAGTSIVYTATSRSLAALEILVHLEIRHAPADFVIIPADVPDELVTTLENPPQGWDVLPAGEASRRVGTSWVRGQASIGLRVPSVVVRGEHNVLVNPRHQEFGRVAIAEPEPFFFDPRLRDLG